MPSYDFSTIFVKVSAEPLKFLLDLKTCFWENKDNSIFIYRAFWQDNLWKFLDLPVKQNSLLSNQINNFIQWNINIEVTFYLYQLENSDCSKIKSNFLRDLLYEPEIPNIQRKKESVSCSVVSNSLQPRRL